jgi:SHAQKYF class myb-like DNA-binding protein
VWFLGAERHNNTHATPHRHGQGARAYLFETSVAFEWDSASAQLTVRSSAIFGALEENSEQPVACMAAPGALFDPAVLGAAASYLPMQHAAAAAAAPAQHHHPGAASSGGGGGGGGGGSKKESEKKGRKPYTITKPRESWTKEEHQLFLDALAMYERDWKRIGAHVGTKRSVGIIRREICQ